MIWIAVLLLALAAAPFLREHYRTVMNDGRRGSAAGQFAELGQGVTHYHLLGPVNGPLIVCIHGLTTPSFVWTGLAKGLAGLGFRVLTYDLYGRGYSDRSAGLQDKAFFNRQLDALLAHLRVEAPFHVIGYSMGGAIAAGFCAAYPTRVRRLVLIASAGTMRGDPPLRRFLKDRGIAGLWLMLVAYPTLHRRGIRAECDRYNISEDITEGQRRELDFRGFIPAVLSSLRGILRNPMEGEHLTLAQGGLPVLALWGGKDEVIPASAMGQLAAWNRTVIHEVIENAGHGLPYTHQAETLQHIAAFLPAPQGDDWGHDT